MTIGQLPAQTRRRIRKLEARDVATLRELHSLIAQLHQGAGPPDRYRNVEVEEQTGERAVYGVAGLNVALAELGRPMEPVKAVVYAAMILFGEAWPRVFDALGVTSALDRAFQGNLLGLPDGARATRAAADRPIRAARALPGRRRLEPLAPPLPGTGHPALPAPPDEE